MGCLYRYIIAIVFLLFFFPVFGGDAIKDGGLNLTPVSSESELLLPVGLDDEFSALFTDHFLIAHDSSPAEAKKLADQLERGFEDFRIFFETAGFELQRLQERLAWIHFSDSDHYSSYALRTDKMDLSHLSGYYSAKTNRVAIRGPHSSPSDTSKPARAVQSFDIAAIAGDETGLQSVKIAHELSHQLAFNTGLQKRGVMYPVWVSEGLATQYETGVSCCGDTNAARKDRLLKMQAHGRLIPLDEFISITRLPAGQAMCEDLYAQAWGFFNFLLKSRPHQLKNYLNVLCNVQPGVRPPSIIYEEFTDSFGSIDLLCEEWIRSICGQ